MKNNKPHKNDDYELQNGVLSADCDNNRKKGGRNKRIKNAPHIDNASFLALLIRSFVSFSLIIILGVVAIFILANWAFSPNGINIRQKNISDYKSYLESGNYQKIPSNKILGDNGWLEVVTADGNTVYSTRAESGVYTQGELDCIVRYNVGETREVHNFKLATDKYNYLVTISYNDSKGNPQERYYLLSKGEDGLYHIVSSSISTTKTSFTQQEYEYLTYNAVHSEQMLYRLSFKGADGVDYYAVFLSDNENNTAVVYLLIVVIVLCILALFATVMVFYVRYINKHVQKPLAVLSYAMTTFPSKEKHEHLNYKGSKEFEHLYDSFNEMVDLLDASEQQKLALEADKQRMLAGLSHDLKTPVTIIQGFTKAIKDGLVSDEDKQKYLQIILTKSDQMVALINQFYEYNKLEHPDFALDKKPCDVAELARSFLAGIYDEFEIRGYNLDAQICEERLVCDLDKGQFLRVFENITGNFFKYTPKGSTLRFGVQREENKVKIAIADNGLGINEESKKDVFEAFAVGEKSRNNQGSGLGLAVCKKIVTMHGGNIELAKEPIKGYNTEFDITLDLSEDSQK